MTERSLQGLVSGPNGAAQPYLRRPPTDPLQVRPRPPSATWLHDPGRTLEQLKRGCREGLGLVVPEVGVEPTRF